MFLMKTWEELNTQNNHNSFRQDIAIKPLSRKNGVAVGSCLKASRSWHQFLVGVI